MGGRAQSDLSAFQLISEFLGAFGVGLPQFCQLSTSFLNLGGVGGGVARAEYFRGRASTSSSELAHSVS